MQKRHSLRHLLPSYQRLLLSTAPLVLAFVAPPVAVLAADWTGGAGNNDWFDVGNWDSAAVPDEFTNIYLYPGNVSITGAAVASGINVYPGSSLTVTGVGTTLQNRGFAVNESSLTIENGAQVWSDSATIGDSGTGATGLVSGADTSWTISDQMTVGSYGGGSLRIEDGATVSSMQGYVGAGNGVVGDVTVTGSGSNWQITNYGLTLGNYGTGTITIEDGGLVHSVSGVLLGGSDASSSGTLNINGTATSRGVLETGYVQIGDGTGDVTLDGGIIRATENNNYFFLGFGSQQIQLATNGGYFDTNGYNIRVAPELTGTGALTKQGAGILTLTGTNTYSGNTTIEDGTLRLGNNGTTGSLVGDVANDGILAFNRSDVVTFGGTISGSGGVQQVGSGQTILTANNAGLLGVSGVYDGILSVNNTLGGSMEVRGGRLQA